MSKQILVVDDSASIRQVAQLTLEQAGYEVMTAEDGVDALNKLSQQRVHLIISDLNMPNMDGLTLLEKVKQLPSAKFTPFVMLTTESGESFMTKGKAHGAKAWMVKPFTPASLVSVVQKLIS